MNEKPGNEAPATTSPRPTLHVEKAIVLCLSAIGTIALTHVAWYRLLILLWHWVNKAWWHWVPALFAFAILSIGPPLALMGTISVMKARPRTKHLFWWTTTAFLAAVALGLLLLWAFLPSGSWWRNGYWWIWAVLVIALSILGVGARMFTVVQPVVTRKERDTFAREWRFNHGDINSPPALGLAMSGGGIRSAAFNLGVLQALHESGILRLVDVMSAVSGGTYIMSWFLLQPFYAAKARSRDNDRFRVSDVINEMFDMNGRFQHYLRTRPKVVEILSTGIAAAFGATLEQPLRAFTSIGDNLDQFNSGGFSRKSYRESIQKLFHGHPHKDSPGKIENTIGPGLKQRHTAADFAVVTPVTYSELAKFAEENNLPFFIFNGAALVDRPFRHMLWPTAFELTADDLGTDVCGYRRWDDLEASDAEELHSLRKKEKRWPRLLRKDREEPGHWVKMVNLAPAISGAAIGLARFDPKKPERSMKLATWIPFIGNIDLGYLLPRKILNSESAVYVSDGGHAENLGAYALIRRKCRAIIIVDAEHEPTFPYVFEGYCKLKERLKEERSELLNVDIIDAYLENQPACPPPPVMMGTVSPANDIDSDERSLSIVYIKLGLDRSGLDLFPQEVCAYAEKNDLFPQDPTSDQTFTPEQFTAYRVLGRHIGSAAVASVRTLL